MADSLPNDCVYSACICCFTSCKKDLLIGCKGKEVCFCIEEECCCAANEEQKPIGMIKGDEYFVKCGLPCCTCGIKKSILPFCLGAGECLCFRQAAAFPFADEVPGPICAVCFLQHAAMLTQM